MKKVHVQDIFHKQTGRKISWSLLAIASLFIASAVMEPLSASAANAVTSQTVTYSKAGLVKNCGTMQGGASDGEFLYFACVTDASSKIRIVKVTTSGQIVARSSVFPRSKLGHANDITYNSKLNLLVVSTWDTGGGSTVAFIDPSTFELKSTGRTNDGSSTSNICYNGTTDEYVIGGKIYDSNFKYTNKRIFTPSGVDEDANTTEGKVLNQGIECDSKYIYVMRVVYGQRGYNMISVYDWNGTNVGLYKLDLNDEGENMSVINGTFYMGINEGGMSSGGDSDTDYFIRVDGINTGSTSRPLVLGSYNIKSIPDPKENGCDAKERMSYTVKNIQDMHMDIVGIQEFGDYNKEEPSKCKGEVNKLLDGLNANGGNWKATSIPAGTDGGGYQETQASIIWNASNVTLVSDEAKNFFGGAIGDTWPSGNHCRGGSTVYHVAGFADASGKTFYVMNAHWCTDDVGIRRQATQNLVTAMSSYSGQKFIVGDTNSGVGEEVEKIVGGAGYGDSHVTAATKKNETLGTMWSNGKNSKNIIDRIYYDTSTISAPSQYETLDCNSMKTCGSDHKPIVATFPSVLIGSGNCNSNSPGGNDVTNTTNAYKALNNIHFTGSNEVCCDTATSTGDLVGDTNGEKAYNFFITTSISTNGGKPMTPAQAAGVVGNLMLESGGNTYKLNTEAHNDILGGHTGIAQWDDHDRFSKLKEFASENKTDWKDLKTQLQFIVKELESRYARVVKDDAFKNASNDETGARTAAKRWNALYEIGGGDDVRANNAAKAFGDFGDAANATTDTSTTTPTTDTSASTLSTGLSGDAAACASTSSGEYVFPLQGTKEQIRTWGNDPGTTEWKSGLYHQTVFAGYYAVDIMAPEGTPVVAFHGGKVLTVDRGSYGELFIEILDDSDKANTKYKTGYTYFYTHMSYSKGTKLKEGDTVTAGMVIGYVGNTTDAWGSPTHLHIDKSQNPGNGLRGTCTASRGYCPVASEDRFVKIVTELHDAYEQLGETSDPTL